MKKVTVLCSDSRHPVNVPLDRWSKEVAPVADVQIIRTVAEARGGDFLFLVSCQEIVRAVARSRYRHTLVLHASALPTGRGMSPHVWQLLDGQTELTMTLLNAADPVDSGDIWRQVSFNVPRSATFVEINARLFDTQIELMSWALQNCERHTPTQQQGTPSYYRRRTPADSEIDPRKPLMDSFDLLRLADPERYPAYFTLHDRKFRITIEPMP
jgi:methionyl-tRNA formyltransferase